MKGSSYSADGSGNGISYTSKQDLKELCMSVSIAAGRVALVGHSAVRCKQCWGTAVSGASNIGAQHCQVHYAVV